MSKRESYEQRTEAILLPILEKHGFSLWDVEYVKEGGNWYLRAYIDKPDGIGVNDCEEFRGILKAYDKDSVTIEMDDSREKTFEKSEIALVRLAFDF